MTQQPLFCEDIYEALRTIAQAYGGPNGSGSKKMGSLLWPDKPVDKAAQLWTDCLNRTRAEKLDPEQVILVLKIGREIGCHVGIDFISKECNYRWETIEPEDEQARLIREFNAGAARLEKLLADINKLNAEVKK